MRHLSSAMHHWSASPVSHHHWFSVSHHCLALAERTFIRGLMITIGIPLIVLGLGLGVSVIMLPAGIAIGFTGVGLVVWGAVGDLPVDD